MAVNQSCHDVEKVIFTASKEILGTNGPFATRDLVVTFVTGETFTLPFYGAQIGNLQVVL